MPTCAHLFSVPLLLSLQSDSILLTFLFSVALSQSLSQLCTIPYSVQTLLISPLFSLYIHLFFTLRPSLYPPSPCHTSFLNFLHSSLRGIHLKPWFLIHNSSPVMTTSRALTFSLKRLSWSDRNVIPSTLSTHTSSSPLCCFVVVASGGVVVYLFQDCWEVCLLHTVYMYTVNRL